MDHIGVEQTITALGRTWTVGRWDRAVWREMFEYARKTLPNPIEEAAKHLDKLPQAAAEFLVRAALDKASSMISVASPEMQSLLSTIDGNAELMRLLLKKKHPDITEDQAFEIVQELGEAGTLNDVFSRARGRMPAGNSEAPAAQP